jgi:hypothetical protein
VRHDASVFLYAFDLIEFNGGDLRRDPLEVRKATLKSVLEAGPGLRPNEHIEADGPTVFAHACKMGLEGIVSKHKDLDVPVRPFARLAQVQEPRVRGGEARSRRGLGTVGCVRREDLDEALLRKLK